MGTILMWTFLLPGTLACKALGLGQSDGRDLVRSLVTTLVWTTVGLLTVAALV
jgi:hypothetical protein